jgi:hypothetical protein
MKVCVVSAIDERSCGLCDRWVGERAQTQISCVARCRPVPFRVSRPSGSSTRHDTCLTWRLASILHARMRSLYTPHPSHMALASKLRVASETANDSFLVFLRHVEKTSPADFCFRRSHRTTRECRKCGCMNACRLRHASPPVADPAATPQKEGRSGAWKATLSSSQPLLDPLPGLPLERALAHIGAVTPTRPSAAPTPHPNSDHTDLKFAGGAEIDAGAGAGETVPSSSSARGRGGHAHASIAHGEDKKEAELREPPLPQDHSWHDDGVGDPHACVPTVTFKNVKRVLLSQE